MSHDPNRRDFLTTAAGGLAVMALMPSFALGSVAPPGGLRIGVVGAGRQGRSLIGELQKIEGVSVVSVCDIDERRLDAGVRRASGAQGYASVAAMLGGVPVDGVVIATPTHTHREIAEACFGAGRHVYCECPLAHTPDDCRAIIDGARASGGVVAAGFQGRSNPVYALAWGFFRSDSVRQLVMMRAQANQKTTWVSPTRDQSQWSRVNWKLDPEVSLGLPGEWGAQQFDVFHWYTGKYPLRVTGRGGVRLHNDGRTIPDTVSLDLEFDGGATLAYQATLASSYEGTHEVFFGSNATIKLAWTHGWMFKEADAPTQGWEVYANRQQFHNDEGITLIADATKLASQGKLKEGVGLPHPPEYYALVDWIAAITNGTSPACTVEEAARATVVGISAHRAVMEGRPIEIDFSALE
ncbi:MAG: Gfo/Idh/MocA family protein [Phycisphaerales bacterium]